MTEPTIPGPSPYDGTEDELQDQTSFALRAVTSVRTGKAAGDWALGQVGKDAYHGLCKAFVRTAFNVVPSQSGTAREAWAEAKHKHRETVADKIPAYVPVFMDTAASAEHVVITVGTDKAGHRLCVSTDAGPGKAIGLVRLDLLAKSWGPILGWTEDLDGQRVWTAPAKPKTRGKLTDALIAQTRRSIATNERLSGKGDKRATARLPHLRASLADLLKIAQF